MDESLDPRICLPRAAAAFDYMHGSRLRLAAGPKSSPMDSCFVAASRDRLANSGNPRARGLLGECRSPLERDANTVPPGKLYRPERSLHRTSLVADAEASAIEVEFPHA